MFSQIENDMNQIMDFKLSKTSAVLLFTVFCWLGYMIGGCIGVLIVLATEVHRYWRGCLHETTR